MYTLIVFLPLIGFVIAGVGGRVIGARGAELVTTAFLLACALLSWVAFFQVANSGREDALVVPVANWVTSGN